MAEIHIAVYEKLRINLTSIASTISCIPGAFFFAWETKDRTAVRFRLVVAIRSEALNHCRALKINRIPHQICVFCSKSTKRL